MYSNTTWHDRENDYGIAVSDLPGKITPCWKGGVSVQAMMAGARRA